MDRQINSIEIDMLKETVNDINDIIEHKDTIQVLTTQSIACRLRLSAVSIEIVDVSC